MRATRDASDVYGLRDEAQQRMWSNDRPGRTPRTAGTAPAPHQVQGGVPAARDGGDRFGGAEQGGNPSKQPLVPVALGPSGPSAKAPRRPAPTSSPDASDRRGTRAAPFAHMHAHYQPARRLCNGPGRHGTQWLFDTLQAAHFADLLPWPAALSRAKAHAPGECIVCFHFGACN